MSLLRSPAAPEKPRITKLKNGGWLCRGSTLGGMGWTPQAAYRAWKLNCMLRGAEVHRTLRPFA